MVPLHEPPHKKGKHEHKTRLAFNTPENASKAIATGRKNLGSLITGKVWTQLTPHHELEIKGSLMLNNAVVAILHFSPEDGSLLPKGLHALSQGKPEIVSLVKTNLPKIINEMSVLDGAEFREPESCWAIPLAHQGRIVGHLKTSADGNNILPDKKATEEMNRIDRMEE